MQVALGYPHSSYSKSILKEIFCPDHLYSLLYIQDSRTHHTLYLILYINYQYVGSTCHTLFFSSFLFSLHAHRSSRQQRWARSLRYPILYYARNSGLRWDSARVAHGAAAPIPLWASGTNIPSTNR
jgi:hypothetical protein